MIPDVELDVQPNWMGEPMIPRVPLLNRFKLNNKKKRGMFDTKLAEISHKSNRTRDLCIRSPYL